MNSIQRGEYTQLAQHILRANRVELGDDPRDVIQVAHDIGKLTLDAELKAELGIRVPVAAEV